MLNVLLRFRGNFGVTALVIFAISLFGCSVLAADTRPIHSDPEVSIGTMVGDKMSVEFGVDEKGEGKLVTRELVEEKGKTTFKTHQTLQVKAGKSEFISIIKSYYCEYYDKRTAYAVLSLSKARAAGENGKIKADRAWVVNEEDFTLDEVKDASQVQCWWVSEDGKAIFPFKKSN